MVIAFGFNETGHSDRRIHDMRLSSDIIRMSSNMILSYVFPDVLISAYLSSSYPRFTVGLNNWNWLRSVNAP